MRLRLAILAIFIFIFAPRASALESDQILLLVNKNVPESEKLAEFYRAARQIPEANYLALDLPVTEDIPFATYEEKVVPAVTDFLRANKFEKKITCILCFYGVPLRIAARAARIEEKKELAELQTDIKANMQQVRMLVSSMEDEAKLNPPDRPASGDELLWLSRRWDNATKALVKSTQGKPEAEQKAVLKSLLESAQKLIGPIGVLQRFAPATGPPLTEAQVRDLSDQAQRARVADEEARRVQSRRADPMSRQRLRDLFKENFGLIEHTRLLMAQGGYLDPAESTAAFDNELALVWWGYYGRTKWVANPFYYRFAGAHFPHTLMVMRLDAPQPQQVRDMIMASIKVERDGLKGRVVIDSRGMHEPSGKAPLMGSYAWYDDGLRNLAEIVRTKTKLELTHDDNAALLAPDSAKDVALYCGWYSLRHYIPCCTFNPGAVGFHVASSELVSLRGQEESGWCANLIKNGVCGTLGPVAEPYLHSFPAADDFFPVLMTGKLPLAEVYWRTTPMTSWMQAMIGDPLYTPYKKNPALKVEDVPERLRMIFAGPTTHPIGPME